MPDLTQLFIIASNGDLVLSCASPHCASEAAELHVVESVTEQEIDGEIIRTMDNERGGWLIFRPTTPFVLGQSFYTVLLLPSGETAVDHFAAGWATPADGDVIAFTSSVEQEVAPSGTIHCCTNELCIGCGATCFGDLKKLSASVNVSFTPTAFLSQYLLQGTFTAEGMAPVVSDVVSWREPVRAIFDEDHSSYCFVVTAESIADGTRTEVAKGCVTGSVVVGEQETPQAERAEALLTCLEPIAGLEDEWCAAWRPTCPSTSNLLDPRDECGAANLRCGWTSADAGTIPEDSDGGASVRHEGDGSLCSVGTGAMRSRWLESSWLIALGFLYRRSKRARRPASASR